MPLQNCFPQESSSLLRVNKLRGLPARVEKLPSDSNWAPETLGKFGGGNKVVIRDLLTLRPLQPTYRLVFWYISAFRLTFSSSSTPYHTYFSVGSIVVCIILHIRIHKSTKICRRHYHHHHRLGICLAAESFHTFLPPSL